MMASDSDGEDRMEGRVRGNHESSDDLVPGYRNYIVYTDESGIHGAKYYGFGSLWIPWQRRGALTGQLCRIRERHRLDSELKWTKVSRRTEAFARDVIEWFFMRVWMMFHCVIVPRADVHWDLHKDRDEAQQKHFSMLLKNKIARFATGGGKLYRIRVDPLPWRYPRAGEVVQKVINAQLKKELGEQLVYDVIACDSKLTVGIQLADLLLGAVIGAWQQDVSSEPKLRIMQCIAEHLGWPHLRHDTHSKEWKFNVWHLYDPSAGQPRKANTLEVRLKHVLPAYQPANGLSPASPGQQRR